jgi:hypothetical protein
MYSVVYRSGGTHRCFWTKVLTTYENAVAAFNESDRLLRAGYTSMVFLSDALEKIGLPIGWEAGSVDWKKDIVRISAFQTYHEKAV